MSVEKHCFFRADFGAFFPEIQPNSPEETHIYVRNPHQSETRNEVAAPIGVKKLIASDDQKCRGYIVAEAIFASKKIEELALINPPAYFTFRNAIVAKFADHFFMGNGPSYGSNGKGKQKEREYLQRQVHNYEPP